jgi:DNA-directed RNA polymerase specialized sigma24 family protein
MVNDDLHELVAAAQRGERQALDSLIREVITPLAWRACRKYVGRTPDPAVALEDVVQLVVHAAVQSLGRFQIRDGSLDAFVYGIARHKTAETGAPSRTRARKFRKATFRNLQDLNVAFLNFGGATTS